MTNASSYKVNLTPNAISNIQSIVEFYIEYPQAARDFLADFDDKVKMISDNPYMYPIPSNLPNFSALEYRKAIVYKHHAILYVVDDETRTIHIVYAVDTRQNNWLADPLPIKLIK